MNMSSRSTRPLLLRNQSMIKIGTTTAQWCKGVVCQAMRSVQLQPDKDTSQWLVAMECFNIIV